MHKDKCYALSLSNTRHCELYRYACDQEYDKVCIKIEIDFLIEKKQQYIQSLENEIDKLINFKRSLDD